MLSTIADPVGALWLQTHIQASLVAPLYATSSIGSRRVRTTNAEGMQHTVYPESMRPASTIAAHVQFHLRHEIPHLELLESVFTHLGGAWVQEWINQEPTGQYARRTAFLYEWLTGATLDLPATLSGNYVAALPADKLVVSDTPTKNTRWRINNNIAGSPHFAPMVVKTTAYQDAVGIDIPALLAELDQAFGFDLTLRSAVWLTLRESKASFSMEGEGQHASRIQRFAQVIADYTGTGHLPLHDAELAQLQQHILGPRHIIKKLGLRTSPVFVGHVEQRGYQEIVHYIAPPAESLADKLQGLAYFLQSTQDQASVMRAAVLAFGFVYIHPLADGNGRVHRFLINDMLRRDGAVHAPFILPISHAIATSSLERAHYDQLLDKVSKPLMQKLAGKYGFTNRITTYSDGIRSNLELQTDQDVWRFLDLTPHVAYLSRLAQHVIAYDMRSEAQYLQRHYAMRAAIKEVVEMPDADVDRIIRSVQQEAGILSHKLLKELPVLGEAGVWAAVVEAVNTFH